MARAKADEPDPTVTYVCVNGYSQDHPSLPPMATFPHGCRLRGSHPAVRLRPECWVREDADDEEVARAQAEVGAVGVGRMITRGPRAV